MPRSGGNQASFARNQCYDCHIRDPLWYRLPHTRSPLVCLSSHLTLLIYDCLDVVWDTLRVFPSPSIRNFTPGPHSMLAADGKRVTCPKNPILGPTWVQVHGSVPLHSTTGVWSIHFPNIVNTFRGGSFSECCGTLGVAQFLSDVTFRLGPRVRFEYGIGTAQICINGCEHSLTIRGLSSGSTLYFEQRSKTELYVSINHEPMICLNDCMDLDEWYPFMEVCESCALVRA